jgi:hypothetical protein
MDAAGKKGGALDTMPATLMGYVYMCLETPQFHPRYVVAVPNQKAIGIVNYVQDCSQCHPLSGLKFLAVFGTLMFGVILLRTF